MIFVGLLPHIAPPYPLAPLSFTQVTPHSSPPYTPPPPRHPQTRHSLVTPRVILLPRSLALLCHSLTDLVEECRTQCKKTGAEEADALRCGATNYCSRVFQKPDWKQQKRFCWDEPLPRDVYRDSPPRRSRWQSRLIKGGSCR